MKRQKYNNGSLVLRKTFKNVGKAIRATIRKTF